MKQENYTQNFREWVRANRPRLHAEGIAVHLPEETAGNGTYGEFFAASGEATVEIWDYGFSEFHVWLYRTTPQQEEVKTTHHEFQDHAEMYAALDQLVNRMSPVLA